LKWDYPSQIWFHLVQQFQRRRFKCDLFIGKNRLKEKFHKKTRENVFAKQLQLKFELIWTCTKSSNGQLKKFLFSEIKVCIASITLQKSKLKNVHKSCPLNTKSVSKGYGVC
jgi:hypothetical protein